MGGLETLERGIQEAEMPGSTSKNTGVHALNSKRTASTSLAFLCAATYPMKNYRPASPSANSHMGSQQGLVLSNAVAAP